MLPFILLSTYLSLTVADLLPRSNECTASVEYKVGKSQDTLPLILTSASKRKDFLYPQNGTTILRIPKGASIYLACPGKNNYIENSGTSKEAEATCIRGQIFNVQGVPRNFSSLACKFIPQHEARRRKTPCLGRHSTIEIGFEVNGTFLQTIEVCRDDKSYTTYYAKFLLSRQIGSQQIAFPRPGKWWTEDHYPGLNLQQLYKFESQVAAVAKILNSTEIAKRRLNKSLKYLSRGHLTAKADFVYGSQQRSTFWYINAAPQWQSFNGGNWNSLEESVRTFAANRRLDLNVYTGVHGHMTMKDARGRQQPIYMHYTNKRKAMPVPKFFWKIIYDPLSRKGTAFIGLNDPFVESIGNDTYICDDISSKIKWLTWKPMRIDKGISYACEINDLRKAVPTIPPLNVNDLLI